MNNEPLQISQRGIEMPASPIRKLAPLAYNAEDEGVKFCVWCLSDFRYKDETTGTLKPSGTKGLPVTGETIMMAPAAGFYTTPGAGKDQVRLAYVLCKEDLKRALMILEKAIDKYTHL